VAQSAGAAPIRHRPAPGLSSLVLDLSYWFEQAARSEPNRPARSFRPSESAALQVDQCSELADGSTLRVLVQAAVTTLIEALDLKDAILVGHSTGGGEVTRYIGRHGTSRVAKAVLLGAVPPLMVKTEANPGGLPIEAFDEVRAGVSADRSQFYKDLSAPFSAPTGRAPRSRRAFATRSG
jgi:pimeloyl-ACP methyl ester carboxylesterase